MTKSILISGINGFVGSHLAELYLKKGFKVHGTIRQKSDLDNIEHIKDQLKLHYCSITDSHGVREVIESNDFKYIHHLAAISLVPYSWKNPVETFQTNVIGTINLLEAIRKSGYDSILHICGSSEEYGLIFEDEIPIKETNELRPMSPYGVSKIAQDKLGCQYHHSYGIKTVITRAHNHTGPRRGEVFVCSNFAKQIAEIEKGNEPIIHVGNLTARRDFTDVRDIVKAYNLAVNKCNYGEAYNICSGKSRSIQEVLDVLLSLSKKKIKVVQDDWRMRPSDVQILEGDYSKFHKATGWKPTIDFKRTMKDLLDYWRERV